MPSSKLILNPAGLDAQIKLLPEDDEIEEGEIDDDEEDSDCELKSENGQVNGDRPDQINNTKHAKISLFEIQSFLIALILPEPRLSTPPSWCRVIRCMRASNVGIFLFDNVDLDWIEDKGSKFTHAFRFETGPNWIEKLTSVPLSRRMQDMNAPVEFGSRNGYVERNLNAAPKISKTSLLLSPIQMIAENYPMPTDESILPSRSKYYLADENSPMFAIDCEMCITTDGRSELTKISIVDEDLRVVYNELVKPENEIINYLTRYSGITREMMEDVTTSIEDVRYFIKKNLPRDAIICGHSLNNDLAAIQIFHPYVIDTSVIFNRTGVRSHKPSLKSLAYVLLGKDIQSTDKLGHDSLEDAITTMELVKLKLVNGLLFGDCVAYEASQGLKYDMKTGITHLQIDKFIERHNTAPVSYRSIDTTPMARCLYVHDKQEPLEQEVRDAVVHLLNEQGAICVVLTNQGECYVKF